MKAPIVRAHIALFTVNIIYAVNYLVAKGIMPDHIKPSGFILLRVAGALPLFWAIKGFFKEKVERKDFPRLILCGLFGIAINQLLFFNGLNLTSPVNAAIIMTSNPILVLVIASLLIKEVITRRKLSGVILGAAGAVILIYSSGGAEDNNQSSVLGDVLVLFNAISYGIYLVIVKPLMMKYKAITVISWVFLFGFFMVLPFGYEQFVNTEWADLSTDVILGACYVVLGTTFFAYALNIYALKFVSPTVSSSYIYLQPVTVMLLSALLFAVASHLGIRADITPIKIVCTLMIFGGVYLVSGRNIVKR